MNCSQKKIVHSSNKEITMADSTADKARKARNRAEEQNYPRGYSRGSTDRLVMDLTRGKAKGLDRVTGRFIDAEEQRAANLMQQRRRLDTAKTAARGNAIEKRVAAKKAEKTLMTGATGGAAAKKQAPKPVTKKAAATKPKTIGTGPNKAKVTPMPPANKNAKGLPKTGRQNVKKSGKK
jgi:hypothetical protein